MAPRHFIACGTGLVAVLWLVLGPTPTNAKTEPSATRLERAVLQHLICRKLGHLDPNPTGGLHYHGDLLGDVAHAALGAPHDLDRPTNGSEWSYAALLPVVARLAGHDPAVNVVVDANGRVEARFYDPSSPFFAWIGRMVPRPSERICGRPAAEYYAHYQSAIRTFASAYVFLGGRGTFAAFSKDAYLTELRGDSTDALYTESCNEFVAQAAEGGRWLSATEPTLTAQACHFWLRRSMDSTRLVLARLLRDVVKPFDSVWWGAWGRRLEAQLGADAKRAR
jgi:hypothetical protein